jgi:hypothetical protein
MVEVEVDISPDIDQGAVSNCEILCIREEWHCWKFDDGGVDERDNQRACKRCAECNVPNVLTRTALHGLVYLTFP